MHRSWAGGVLTVVLLAPARLWGQEAAAPPPASPTTAPTGSEQVSESEMMRRRCVEKDLSSPLTADGAAERAKCWQMVQLAGGTDSAVQSRLALAQSDAITYRKTEDDRRNADSSTADLKIRLENARLQVASSNLDEAERLLRETAAIYPGDQRVQANLDNVVQLKRVKRIKYALTALAGTLVALAAAAMVGIKALTKRREEKAAARQAELDRRKAALQILDGVGRGRLVPIESAIFRIGAASSSKAEERNDLVLSDQGGTVSRYHCSVARKGGDYFLIDSSRNGTFLNDGMLAQGSHHRLEDGDEITIADVARLKFVLA